jgi:hypothetical protein
MVAEMHFLEPVSIMSLDGLATVNRSCVRHMDPVLRVERGQGSGIAVVECVVSFLLRSSSCWRSLSLGVGSFCWAKIGKAKLIANPANHFVANSFHFLREWFNG